MEVVVFHCIDAMRSIMFFEDVFFFAKHVHAL